MQVRGVSMAAVDIARPKTTPPQALQALATEVQSFDFGIQRLMMFISPVIGRSMPSQFSPLVLQLLAHGREGMVGARTQGEIGMHALRGGDVVGDHTVHFAAIDALIDEVLAQKPALASHAAISTWPETRVMLEKRAAP